MGTVARTDTNAEGKARTELEVKAKFKVIVDTWDNSNRKFTWQAIDESIKALQEHGWLRRMDITKYWGDILDPTSISRANYASQISGVAAFFANPKSIPGLDADKLYNKWKNKCGIRTIYNEIHDGEKRLADKMGKRMEKANNTNKESAEEEAEALENVGNTQGAEAIRGKTVATNKPKRRKETSGWTAPIYSLDKEIKKNIKQLIQGEPQTFYRMIVSFSEIGVLSEEWGDLANKEMAKLG